MIDCEKLSANSQNIFQAIKAHYPPGAFQERQCTDEGKVYDNGWYDLRKSEDRKRLKEKKLSIIGYFVEIDASVYHKEHGSLAGFADERISEAIQNKAELLLLLNDLDFQIETGDLVDP